MNKKKKINLLQEDKKQTKENVVESVATVDLGNNTVQTTKPKNRILSLFKFQMKDRSGQPRRGLQANVLSSGAKHSMRTRIISAIVGLSILVPAILLGDLVYFGLMTFALALACWEILGCANKRTFVIFIIYFLFVALLAYWPIFRTAVVY